MNKDTFICDGCGKEQSTIEIEGEVSNPQLSGIVTCKKCMEENELDYNAISRHVKVFKDIITPYDWEVVNFIESIGARVLIIGCALSIGLIYNIIMR